MRTSLLSIIVGFVALACGQVVPPGGSFPTCGTPTIITAISSAGCSVTDAECVCKAKTVSQAIQEKILKVCKKDEDRAVYLNFINAQCLGKPGYPLVQKTHNGSSSDASSLRVRVWGVAGVAGMLAVAGI